VIIGNKARLVVALAAITVLVGSCKVGDETTQKSATTATDNQKASPASNPVPTASVKGATSAAARTPQAASSGATSGSQPVSD
jgi:hypothetical protein